MADAHATANTLSLLSDKALKGRELVKHVRWAPKACSALIKELDALREKLDELKALAESISDSSTLAQIHAPAEECNYALDAVQAMFKGSSLGLKRRVTWKVKHEVKVVEMRVRIRICKEMFIALIHPDTGNLRAPPVSAERDAAVKRIQERAMLGKGIRPVPTPDDDSGVFSISDVFRRRSRIRRVHSSYITSRDDSSDDTHLDSSFSSDISACTEPDAARHSAFIFQGIPFDDEPGPSRPRTVSAASAPPGYMYPDDGSDEIRSLQLDVVREDEEPPTPIATNPDDQDDEPPTPCETRPIHHRPGPSFGSTFSTPDTTYNGFSFDRDDAVSLASSRTTISSTAECTSPPLEVSIPTPSKEPLTTNKDSRSEPDAGIQVKDEGVTETPTPTTNANIDLSLDAEPEGFDIQVVPPSPMPAVMEITPDAVAPQEQPKAEESVVHEEVEGPIAQEEPVLAREEPSVSAEDSVTNDQITSIVVDGVTPAPGESIVGCEHTPDSHEQAPSAVAVEKEQTVEEFIVEAPVADKPTAAETATEKPSVNGVLVVEVPVLEDPTPEEIPVEKPAIETPTEEHVIEDTITGGVAVDVPTAEDANVEGPVPKLAPSEEAVDEENKVEKVDDEEPVVRESVAEATPKEPIVEESNVEPLPIEEPVAKEDAPSQNAEDSIILVEETTGLSAPNSEAATTEAPEPASVEPTSAPALVEELNTKDGAVLEETESLSSSQPQELGSIDISAPSPEAAASTKDLAEPTIFSADEQDQTNDTVAPILETNLPEADEPVHNESTTTVQDEAPVTDNESSDAATSGPSDSWIFVEPAAASEATMAIPELSTSISEEPCVTHDSDLDSSDSDSQGSSSPQLSDSDTAVDLTTSCETTPPTSPELLGSASEKPKVVIEIASTPSDDTIIAPIFSPPVRRISLHAAVMSNSLSTVRTQLETFGDDLNARWHGKTPLQLALELQAKDIVAYLFSRGAMLSLNDLQYSTSRDFKWAHDESWYRPIRAVLDRVPPRLERTREEVLSVAMLLNKRLALPMPIVRQVMDLAEYWTVSTVSKEEKHRTTHWTPESAYLSSEPIVGRVCKVVFKTTSADQGWAGTKLYDSLYEGSHTWFEAGLESSALAKTKLEVQRNVRASTHYRTHTNIWSSSTGDDEKVRWLESIRPGDRISLYPRAAFRGWGNNVKRAEIIIYTACL